jgi:hypothetical protein
MKLSLSQSVRTGPCYGAQQNCDGGVHNGWAAEPLEQENRSDAKATVPLRLPHEAIYGGRSAVLLSGPLERFYEQHLLIELYLFVEKVGALVTDSTSDRHGPDVIGCNPAKIRVQFATRPTLCQMSLELIKFRGRAFPDCR